MKNIKPSKTKKNIFKDLMILGSATEDVVVEGFTFQISTLSEKENAELLTGLMALDEQNRVILSKAHSVAMSVKKINDQNFDEIIDLIEEIPDDLNNIFAKKIFFISSLQTNIVNKLFEKYVEINSKLEEEDKKK